MKVLTVLGTRPEIIRLSRVIPKLDNLCDHVLVHTGQNFDPKLSDLFFKELEIRPPDHHLKVHSPALGEQIGKILSGCERVFAEERPDKLLILGDTNSSLSAIIAKRMGIPVYHMEAGNRCYDDRVPEEVNRRVIDHSSDILLPYTERSRQNLLREGIPGERIYVTGNPINEVLQHYDHQISQASVLNSLGLKPKEYFLVTMHRAENVDIEIRLRNIIKALNRLQKEYDLPIIVSTHPHTRIRMKAFGIDSINKNNIRFLEPFGFFSFINLERNALCVISDSGTVQEECCLLRVANVTIRDVTERPETMECGSNILGGVDPGTVEGCVKSVLSLRRDWIMPPEYLFPQVSDTVVKILMGFRGRASEANS
jgi:UDP-N-acetylglucosamine 2-epimerase (non-hydrolysing)